MTKFYVKYRKGVFLLLFLTLTSTSSPGILFAQTPISQFKQEVELAMQPSPKFKPLDGLLRFYQRYLSNQIQADCLYHTSCSRFTRKKLKEEGIKGFFIGLDQFIHCTSGMEQDYPANQLQFGKVVRE